MVAPKPPQLPLLQVEKIKHVEVMKQESSPLDKMKHVEDKKHEDSEANEEQAMKEEPPEKTKMKGEPRKKAKIKKAIAKPSLKKKKSNDPTNMTCVVPKDQPAEVKRVTFYGLTK